MCPTQPPRRRVPGLVAAVAAVLAGTVLLGGCATTAADRPPAPSATRLRAEPLVIAHRGASGYLPEHTLAAYALGAKLGADVIEPDLVPTSDHVLVVRHENFFGDSTDVADHPEFADRRTTKIVDGVAVTDWFTEDFTLAELRTLRAREPEPRQRPESAAHDGRYLVPTFEEVLDLRVELTEDLGRTITIAPEIKHSTYFAALGIELEPLVLKALRSHGLDQPGAPVVVQSMELTNLQVLAREGLEVPLVFLTKRKGSPYDLVAARDPRTWKDLLTPQGLRGLRADGIDVLGPDKVQVISREDDDDLGRPTRLVADAHAAGLQVMPYTFCAQNQCLPADFRRGEGAAAVGDATGELLAFLRAGVDGVFTDEPDLGVAARAELLGTS